MATEYKVPTLAEPAPPKPNEVVLVTSGDLRHTANVPAWPMQQELSMEVKGRDSISGLPRRTTVTSIEIREALSQPVVEPGL